MGSIVVVVLGLAAIAAVHVCALAISRRGRSAAHGAAFWGGVVGLVSLLGAPLLAASALATAPSHFAGTGGSTDPFDQIAIVVLAAIALLPLWSGIAAWLAIRGAIRAARTA